MPRVFDLHRRGVRDRDPLAGLLNYNDLDDVIRDAGGKIRDRITAMRDGIVEFIRDTTGIDLSDGVAFIDGIVAEISGRFGVDLETLGQTLSDLLAWFQGIGADLADPQEFLDRLAAAPRDLLDRLAALFGGAPGLPPIDVFGGLQAMFAGLNPDGEFDPAKVLGLEDELNALGEAGDNIIAAVQRAAAGLTLPAGNPLGDLFNAVKGVLTQANSAITQAGAAASTAGAASTAAGNAASTASAAQAAANAAQSAVTAAEQLAQGAIDGVNQAVQAVSSTGAAVGTVFDNILSLLDGTTAAQQAAMAAQAAVAALQGDNNSTPSLGTNETVIFSGADGDPLPAGWTTSNVLIRGSNGNAGLNSALSGALDVGWAQAPWAFTGDDQSVSVVIGEKDNTDNPDQDVLLFARANAAFDSGFCLGVDKKNGCTLGAFSRTPGAGMALGRNVLASTPSGKVSPGSLVELRVSGTTAAARVNGVLVLSYTGPEVPLGAAYRRAGFGMESQNVFIVWKSFRVMAFSMSDFTIPAVTGTGWHLGRGSTAATAAPSANDTVGVQVPAGTFDTNVATSPHVTVQNLGLGEIIVPTTGWYHLHASFRSSSTTGRIGAQDEYGAGIKIWTNASKVATVRVLRGASAVTGQLEGRATTMAAPVVFLTAGQLVAPVWISTATFTMTGSADCGSTCFTGALISK